MERSSMTTDEPVQGDAKLLGNPEPYTPTTEDVRDGYAAMRDQYSYSPTIAKQREYLANGGGGGEFDRWLRVHDAEVIEKARDAITSSPATDAYVDLTAYAARIRRGEGELCLASD